MRRRRIGRQMAKARVAALAKRGRKEPVKAEKRIQATSGFERARAWLFVAALVFCIVIEIGWEWREVDIIPPQIGGYHLHKTLHLGAICFFLFALLLQFGLRLPYCLVWHSYDIEWLRKLGGYTRRYSPVPPAGKYNAGQKLFTFFVLLFGLAYGITGLAMHLPQNLPPDIVRGAFNLHFVSFLVLVCGCLLYYYLFYAATPGRFALLTSGKPTERFLKMHHPHWFEKLKSRVTLETVKERLHHRPKAEEVVEMEAAEEEEAPTEAEVVETKPAEKQEEALEAEVVEEPKEPEEPPSKEPQAEEGGEGDKESEPPPGG